MTLVVAALLVWIAGAAIGATAIGGVLVVPALAGVAGVPVASAIAASSFAFVLTGLLAWHYRAPAAEATLGTTWPLHAAALAGAVAGAWLVHRVPAAFVRDWVAVLAFGSGAYALATQSRAPRRERPWPSAAWLAALGAGVGCGSALSGTGGPVLLIPVLMLLGLPPVASVATAQAIQLPIAAAASVAHAVAGRLDFALGLVVGAALLAGAWAGRRIALRADARTLRRWTAWALVATGLWYGFA